MTAIMVYTYLSHTSKRYQVKSAFILHFFEIYPYSDLTAN